MKTLVIVDHPFLEERSRINKRWIEELEKYPDEFTVHVLPDVKAGDHEWDLEAEQKLVEDHDNIIFQFPIFWMMCPVNMKDYIDTVWHHGWAFGEGITTFHDKKFGVAVSFGVNSDSLCTTGYFCYEPEQVLTNFDVIAKYVGADYIQPFILMGTNNVTDEELEQNAKDYVEYLRDQG